MSLPPADRSSTSLFVGDHPDLDLLTGDPRSMSERLTDDIATLWAADTVEQVARMTIDELAFAHGLGRVLDRASPAAQAAAEPIRSLIGLT